MRERGREREGEGEGDSDSDSNSDAFIWSYCRPRRPLLRPNLVAVAEATWKKIKYTVYPVHVCKNNSNY